MNVKSLSFDIEGFDGGIGSCRVGNHIEIAFQGWPVMGFDLTDTLARDFTIATLLETKLKGKTIAALCHTSPSRISEVRKRLGLGGHQALLRQPSGRKSKLSGTRLSFAQRLRRQGLPLRKIAQQLGTSLPCTARALRGISAPKQVQQETLTGIDQSSVETQGPEGDDHGLTIEDSSMVETLAEDEPVADLFVEALAEALTEDEPLAQDEAPAQGEAPVEFESAEISDEPTSEVPQDKPEELLPGQPLPAGPAEHQCRYAGTLLICAAVQVLGLLRSLVDAGVRRPEKSVYHAFQAVAAVLSAWASGLGSLEAMHERDARALGVVLGLERSPSVRTLHRAIAQMVATFTPITLRASLLSGLMEAVARVPRIFGVDGHFKPYFGKEPIDKGWDTKRRMAHRGLSDVLIHDEQGFIWAGLEVGAGDKLNEHLLSSAHLLGNEQGVKEPRVLGFDRGGFCFETFEVLNREKVFYVAWVPATVKLPDLSTIAPPHDGVGEQSFEHSDLGENHRARLLVRRDGEALVPAMTNLPDSVSATEAMTMLSKVRGVQENDIKAARSFAHIDRLADRGKARRAPDDRPVKNPVRVELLKKRSEVRTELEELGRIEPISRKDQARVRGRQTVAEFKEGLLAHKLSEQPAKVPRIVLEPEAKRAWLKTTNRSLIQPLKYLLANGRRWLLSALGLALAPSDAEWDQSAVNRTLEALIRAPGTVRFGDGEVEVILDLPLPPQPHARLSQGLVGLDAYGLRFTDGQRRVIFRLAPRPTRQDLPSGRPPPGLNGNSK
ncbi:MAG: hypothetical protein V2A73_22310 [Pseudomonadota bacterium]